LKRRIEIDILDLPSIFQISLAQETQQETVEQLIVELKATNDRVEQLSKIAYEQSKLLESLYERIDKHENSRDRLWKTA
jgi:predicted transcriptional regulator